MDMGEIMKKTIIILGLLFLALSVQAQELSIKDLKKMNIVANSPIKSEDLAKAQQIMRGVHQKTAEGVKNGKGPFYAELYDANGNLVVASSNSVVEDKSYALANKFYKSKFRFCHQWLAQAVVYYGYDFMRQVAKWTQICHVNDLHSGNVTMFNGRPIILDYSGVKQSCCSDS